MSSLIFGIDLGTTHSLVGVHEGGFPGLFADSQGRRLTPSAVYFPPDAADPIIGWEAIKYRPTAPSRVVTSVKRLIGRRFSEINPASLPYPTAPDPNGQAAILIDGRLWLPEEISALILKHLRSVAAHALAKEGTPLEPRHLVLTVPAYFNDAQRAATRRAGELAGWQVERILAEPTAAALAFGFGSSTRTQHLAVFDLGGGTFDLTILHLHNGIFEVLSTRGDTALGGDDIDRALAQSALQKLPRQPSSPAEWDALLSAARRAKETLTHSPTAALETPLSPSPITLTRQDLEIAARPVLDRIPPLCRAALHDAGLSPGQLDAVLLVGGATRIPAVRRLAAEIFGKEPDTSSHPDEAVALGACVQAGILSGATRGLALLDVTPLSLGIETYGGLMNVLIPRNSTIPCKAGELFTNAADGQTSMRITILQGEREMARDNWRLGEITITFPPAPRGQARVGVEFALDADGILRVLARDLATGREEILRLDTSARLDDQKVGEMVASSVEHALQDMRERTFTEAALKARELLAALDAALLQLETDIPPAEKTRLLELAAATRNALDQKDHPALAAAVKALDEATEPLATLLLEKLGI